jgi:Fe-S cluster assembly scaffold protein SufB
LANYFFPPELFPSKQDFQRIAIKQSDAAFTQMQKAHEDLIETVHFDKELSRFIKASIPWQSLTVATRSEDTYSSQASCMTYQAIGELPQELFDLLISQTHGFAPFMMRTAQIIRVLTITSSGIYNVPAAQKIDELEFFSEIMLVVVAQDVVATLHDMRELTGVQSRLLVVRVGERSQVTFLSDTHCGSVYGIMQEHWALQQKADVRIVNAVTGGKQTSTFKQYELEEKAHLHDTTLIALKRHEQLALVTQQHHRGRESTSSLLVKAALKDHASSFYRGAIIIADTAAQSNANQQQKSLLLATTARTCAIPSLEVSIDDVQCRHGSAAGHYKREELLFLMSRGFSKESAETLLLEGFYNEHNVQGITDHQLRMNRLMAHIANE